MGVPGWCSFTGHFDFGLYGAADRRRFIDALQGDSVLRAVRAMGHLWKGKRVPIYIDRTAFQFSLATGLSSEKRLSSIVRKLYELSVELDCLLVPIWLSTHDNIGADALSRGDISRFQVWWGELASAGLTARRSGGLGST